MKNSKKKVEIRAKTRLVAADAHEKALLKKALEIYKKTRNEPCYRTYTNNPVEELEKQGVL